MISDIPENEVVWLSKFFAGRNCLRWQQIVSGDGPPGWLGQVMPWLSFLEVGAIDRPVILPVFESDGPKEWYGMANDEHIAAMMAEEIASVVGPSYSDFRGQRCVLSQDDSIESALRQRFGNHVFRFTPLSDVNRREIPRALSLYYGVVSRRPPIPNRAERPFGKVRAEFDLALLAGNASGANKSLAELCESGRVDAEQRKCLEIRLLAGLGRQEELARNHSLISTVMDLALPPQTIADIVEALYETYVEPVESSADLKLLFTVFNQQVATPYGPLFRERKGVRQPKVLRAFLLFEVARENGDLVRSNAVLSAYPPDAEGQALLQRWLDGRTKPETERKSNLLEEVRQAIADEDYEVAIDLSFRGLPEVWAYSALLRCAGAVDSVAVTRRVLAAFDEAHERLLKTLNAKDQSRLERLRAQRQDAESPQIDTNWVAWARWVLNGVYEKSPAEVLEIAIQRWSVDEYLRDADQCTALAQLIGNAKGKSEQVFRDAFPCLVEFFVDRVVQSRRVFAPIYSILVKVIAWSGAVSADELELTTSLAQALMIVGPTKEAYGECLEDLSEIVSANSSTAHMDWALNAAEMVALYPTQDQELRMRFFMTVVSVARTNSHRITNTQRAVLDLLAKDYGCSQLLDTFPRVEVAEAVAAASRQFVGLIGIYTLTESAGRRAKEMLQELLPQARIELNNDAVATDRLKHLASNADVFVFAWRSSKHQAYYCVKAARPDKDLVLPLGKGVASIMRGALDALMQ